MEWEAVIRCVARTPSGAQWKRELRTVDARVRDVLGAKNQVRCSPTVVSIGRELSMNIYCD